MHGKIKISPMLRGREPLDLILLKCLMIEVADVIFIEDKNLKDLKDVAKQGLVDSLLCYLSEGSE